ncbi:hypothetical protein B0I33_110300 [Prauserella shujinwangii]|uniref:Uncharacterized protein n=1 Tax=Prauserella shujinwangii TaxID=1453103 RepID=A0A2T0LPL8_9PSEU|nr:hypothetical protein [Prauserella shujinwangii]PRX45200.1 hypothetical protein B0I33_110300 [Prauserella shujinwangii]
MSASSVSVPPRLPVAHRWSEPERCVVARAALRSPRCGVGDPWTLEIRGERIELSERFAAPSWHHDGAGRDRVLACGAAVAGITVAVRVLGWLPEFVLLPDPARPDLVATVTARVRGRPARVGVRGFRAVFDPRRHRHPADPAELPAELVAEIVQAGSLPGVRLVPVDGAVTAGRKRSGEPGVLVLTGTDGRRDQLLAGAGTHHAVLAAKAHGLTAEPETRPFPFREYRMRVLRAVGLEGCPQLLLRLGH